MSSLIFCLILILVIRLTLTLMLCLTLLLMLCLSLLMNLTIAHIVLVHKRTTLSLYALVMTHILIVVIISRVCLVFLLEGLTLTLSRDTWTVHIFPAVVHVPLGQMMWCKRLWRLHQVAWLSVGFLWFISLTLALSNRPILVLCSWWMEVWRTCDWWTPVALNTWPESLNGSPTSLPCFSCVWFLWKFGLWLFSVLDSFSGHNFVHSMNTHEPNMRFHLFDRFLGSFSWGLGQVHRYASKASYVGPWLCYCDASIGSSHVVALSASRRFCSNKHISSFPRVNISRHASKGESRLHFRTKFCILLTLMISWVYWCCIQVLGSQVFID
jgi:hypothetical protein